MSYYLGQSDIPVKPVTRRTTWTRGMPRAVRHAYLQQHGRCPINRRGYPVTGVPIPTTPTVGAWTNLDLSREPGQNQLGHSIAPITMSVRTRGGRIIGTNPYEGGALMTAPIGTLGADVPAGYGLAPLSMLQSTPSIPSVVAAPAPSSVWDPIKSALALWDARPQAMKNVRFTVDPNQAMRALQTVVKPGQVSGAVNWLRSQGLMPSYQGVPITGDMAGYGYQAAGFDFGKYLPWILGGGALLFVVPMLMKRR
jgi:hypothetical protein